MVACRLAFSEQVNSQSREGEVSRSSLWVVPWFQECRLVPEWLLREVKGEVRAKAEAKTCLYVRERAVCDKGPRVKAFSLSLQHVCKCNLRRSHALRF